MSYDSLTIAASSQAIDRAYESVHGIDYYLDMAREEYSPDMQLSERAELVENTARCIKRMNESVTEVDEIVQALDLKGIDSVQDFVNTFDPHFDRTTGERNGVTVPEDLQEAVQNLPDNKQKYLQLLSYEYPRLQEMTNRYQSLTEH